MAEPTQRSRSPSPTRPSEPKAKKQKTSGFKWKEKKPKEESLSEDRDKDSGRLERGYRNRSPKRDSYRDRGDSYRERERERDRSPRRRDEGERHRDYDRRREEGDTYRPREREGENGRDARPVAPAQTKASNENATSNVAEKFPGTSTSSDKPKKPKKPPPPTSSEPMIIVNINDRLGTKAAIPCLASDSVKAFKAVVAAHIGRQPHEIMLKRQGERPFKDALTLEDYGVSNGVQLDLELDTGD